jgi:phosphate transport system substrate-binding protein
MSAIREPGGGWRAWRAIPVCLALAILPGWAVGTVRAEDPAAAPPNDEYAPAIKVSGRLTIAGSDTMQPILAKLAMAFRRWHPQARLAVQGSRNHGERAAIPPIEALLDGLANSRRGDGKTSGHLGSNQVHLLALSRDLTRDEIDDFVARHGYQPTAIPIAVDSVAVYVNSRNPIEGLTMAQVDAIFSKTRKRQGPADLDTWGQAGLKGPWRDAKIRLYGRNRNSVSTRFFFRLHALLGGEFKDGLKEEPGSASVVLAVAEDVFGIGYSSTEFQNARVRIVPLATVEGGAFVLPTEESVRSGAYPLSRRLHLHVKKHPEETLKPLILEFLRFVSSRTGQAVVADAGVYPLPSHEAAANLRILARWDRQGSADAGGNAIGVN